MNWRVKGLAQKTLSALPGGVRVNDLLQRTLGGLRQFETTVTNKVRKDWLVLVGHMTELGVSPHHLRYVEIGTGWFPTLPVCYTLAGAAGCDTFDLTRHLSAPLTFRMVAALRGHLPELARATGRPLPEVTAAYDHLTQTGSLTELLRRARIEYHAPADASATGLPAASVDVVYSNSVLEHVPPAAIARLMTESHRILRPGGLAIHSANCGDHYAYFDRTITAINYLTYPAADWEFWNNALLYQNRLRPRDFLDLATAAGLTIVLQKHTPRPALLAALPGLQLAPEFHKYPAEQLCCTSIDFVARKP